MAALSLVAACQVDRPKLNLNCDPLPEPSWTALCKRFESAVALQSGHGQRFGNQHWGCIGNEVNRIYCEQPRVPAELVKAIVDAHKRVLERDAYLVKNRKEPSDEEIAPGVEMDVTFAGCAEALLTRFEIAAAVPGWTEKACAEVKERTRRGW
jgi:hypothetical protein